MATGDRAPRCPEFVYLLRRSGKHSVVLIPCGKWRCARCGEAKVEAIWAHLSEITMPDEPMYDLLVPGRQADTVRKAARRRKASYLGISLADKGLYLAADQELSGWGWITSKHDWEDFMAALPAKLADLAPTRTTWVGHWKPESPGPKPDGDVVFRGVAGSSKAIRETLSCAGVSLDEEEVKGDPLRVAERLDVVFGPMGKRTSAVRRSR